MTIDWQLLTTLGVGALTLLQGWVVYLLKANEKRHQEHDARANALRTVDDEIRAKLNEMNLLVQGKYLTREEFRDAMKDQTTLLENLFSRLENKIDRKADK